ncbi:MAG: hypothetical protein QOG62_489 [Thermoleophilaceae bacterium]|nr:hypothetical protein [Thermoleophilaceae bacterium]
MGATGRIVVFGATGYTGRLVSEALVRRGAQPVLAGRSGARLAALAAELGSELEIAEADMSRPESVEALINRGDVLVSTVGPFVKVGGPAVQAAAVTGAHYIDSTGEPPFIRSVFEDHGPRAQASGAALMTAFGYDFVPGNLAGALALRDAGPGAVRVDTGYFFSAPPVAPATPGKGPRGLDRLLAGMGGASGGTMASLMGVLPMPSFAWRGGRLVTERSATRVRAFDVNGTSHPGISVGGSEHLGLPQVFPELQEVNAYLGWFGPLSRAVQASSLLNAGVARLPGSDRMFDAIASRFKTSTGGPDAEARAATGSLITARTYDASGRELSRVVLRGVNGYTFTGEIMAWAAMQAAAGGLKGSGALGPVGAFGLDELEDGCSAAGLSRVVDA